MEVFYTYVVFTYHSCHNKVSVSGSGKNHPAQIPGNTMCEPKQENDAITCLGRDKGIYKRQFAHVSPACCMQGTKGEDVDCAKAATLTTAEHVYTVGISPSSEGGGGGGGGGGW